VRGDVGGRVGPLSYGDVTTAILGPIEQKLIYHFRPGLRVLSLGGSGCNMSCMYCQNFEISQVAKSGRKTSPTEAVAMAAGSSVGGIAFSYNEPLVWYEYVMDVFRLAREAGLATIMKTNGHCDGGAFREVAELTDAINVDIKGPRSLYREICGVALGHDPAKWPMVMNLGVAAGVCRDVEVSMVAIPGFYDDVAEVGDLMGAISDAAPGAPLHILRFIPDFKMRGTPPASVGQMERLAALASKFFEHVYLDFAGIDNDTRCRCGATLVRRRGLEVTLGPKCRCMADTIKG
jgi:pyruvate formate lyase activating enzyme